ncbi:hypothetical protein A1O7_05303 [Cladophialophora yegresii CBS 114405]|uniref:Chromo domain-containing protein n=1 Tax=Cladophialophora yegresii CBS 114405 TaxID=1182544 RepID=W9W830_9EURO|nr:uncharacterized protein A1O7_05303 [Cladophialophora yegresii CBS 114405]EXJ61150.1 hypothetical protein A1O7_05303 [Cladophialophora yegresii CBS 114405]
MELLEGMNIYPVFHKSLLKKAPQNATPGPVLVHEETQEPLYDVEGILKHRGTKRQRQYLVKWLGYEDSENTWEPEENLPREMIIKYHRHDRRH